ncbi:MAG: hypothetical protein O2992_01780 [Gemmatimonadetes bacterium]|jgi:hypothetical protein|nr:hypothetical protein [Gemmatimonadota bacterium]
MKTRALLTVGLFVVLSVASCGGGGAGNTSNGAPRTSMRAPITLEDLPPGRFSDVIDAVQKLRPGWMTRVNGIFVEGHEVKPDDLRMEAVDAIQEIKLLRCEQAMVKYPVNCVSQTYLEIIRKRRAP